MDRVAAALTAARRALLAAVDPDDIERDDRGRFAPKGGGDSSAADLADLARGAQPGPGQEAFDFNAAPPPPPAAPPQHDPYDDGIGTEREGGSPEAHAYLDALTDKLGDPALYDPDYRPTAAEQAHVDAVRNGDYGSLDTLLSAGSKLEELRQTDPADAAKLSAAVELALEGHRVAMDVLDRQGIDTPRSFANVMAMRDVADRLGPGTELDIGNRAYSMRPDTLDGISRGLAHVDTSSLGLTRVTLTEDQRIAGDSGMAYVLPLHEGSTLTFAENLHLNANPEDPDWRGGSFPYGFASVGAARDRVEAAELATIHELGHVLHAASARDANEAHVAQHGDNNPAWTTDAGIMLKFEGLDRIATAASAVDAKGTTGDRLRYSPTTYAGDNAAEFVAESFTLAVMGQTAPARLDEIDMPPNQRQSWETADRLARDLWANAYGDTPFPDRSETYGARIP